jgi:UDP-N-acetylmuramyl pentapeptide phosphotransferase/UDP-N-acetylglucosamine-1-phosphate transferase
VQTEPSVSWLSAYFGFCLGFIAIIVGLDFDQMAGIILFIITMVVFAIQVIFFVLRYIRIKKDERSGQGQFHQSTHHVSLSQTGGFETKDWTNRRE